MTFTFNFTDKQTGANKLGLLQAIPSEEPNRMFVASFNSSSSELMIAKFSVTRPDNQSLLIEQLGSALYLCAHEQTMNFNVNSCLAPKVKGQLKGFVAFGNFYLMDSERVYNFSVNAFNSPERSFPLQIKKLSDWLNCPKTGMS